MQKYYPTERMHTETVRVTANRPCPVCKKPVAIPTNRHSDEVACPHCGALIMIPSSGIRPGVQLDDFQLMQRIGRGAMGEVYLARQQSMDRLVALKVLAPSLTATDEQVRLFHREVRMLARLHHPNITTAFYAGCDRNVHYLAMSYVAGESLLTRVHRKGWMDEEEALSVVYKVAAAMQYAWDEHGLIHRDIKPANILIDVDGEVKLTDLGISKYVYEDVSSMPQECRVIGTPHFMSPEQAQGVSDLDFRSDMYSLGITLYHMLTGQAPFDASTISSILKRQVNDALPPIRECRPDLSRGTEAVLHQLTAKRRENRYGSWKELLNVTKDTLIQQVPATLDAGQPFEGPPTETVWIESDPPGTPLPPQRPRRRRWKRSTFLVLMAAVLGLFAWERQTLQRTPANQSGHALTQALPLHAALHKTREWTVQGVNGLDGLRSHMWQRHVHREQDQRIREVIRHLDERASAHIHNGEIDRAISIYTDYDGPWADLSETARIQRAQALNFDR